MKLKLIIILFYSCSIGLYFNGIKSALEDRGLNSIDFINGEANLRPEDKRKNLPIVSVGDHGQHLTLHLEDQGLTNIKGISRLKINNKPITKFKTVVLFLKNNKLTEIPKSIGKLTNLVTLALNGNRLKDLPDSIENLTNLKYLGLADNNLTYVPKPIGKLTSLYKLDLSDNYLIKVMPEFIGNLTNLHKLYLSSIGVSSLPESIGNLTKLREIRLLHISYGQIKYPKSFEKLEENIKKNLKKDEAKYKKR